MVNFSKLCESTRKSLLLFIYENIDVPSKELAKMACKEFPYLDLSSFKIGNLKGRIRRMIKSGKIREIFEVDVNE